MTTNFTFPLFQAGLEASWSYLVPDNPAYEAAALESPRRLD